MLGVFKAEPREGAVLTVFAALSTPARDVGGRGMLHIYPFILETITILRPLCERIARGDSDLARQMRRAMMSVPLNVAEGFCSQGRNRKSRYYTAFGSAREVLACLEVAQAMGIIPAIEPDISDRLDRIIRTLCRLSQ